MLQNKYGGTNDMPRGWTADETNKKVYNLWFRMLRRCYDESQHARRRGRSYAECAVMSEWKTLSVFSEDIKNLRGYDDWKNKEGWVLDKDILSMGQKIYSKETCCFIGKRESIDEMNSRHPDITSAARKSNKTAYVLRKGSVEIPFDSEESACLYLGVRQCSVASCGRRKCKCKGFDVIRIGRGSHTDERGKEE